MKNETVIVLFDGICNFCSGSVIFIIRRDSHGYFRFAALQTESGAALMGKFNIQTDQRDTLILIENDKAYFRSTAALRIARKLKGAWKLFYLFVIIPPFFRDFFYDLVAKNRYRWFGKLDSCFIPDQSIKKRFLI
jgi:predicted DCC family thiol-disulfide oxidoreductase YuxK